MLALKCVVALFLLLEPSRCLFAFAQNQCGRKGMSSGLIVGGTVSKKNDWPWLAALFNIPTQKFFCGGTIISENHILTAAHCIQQKMVNDQKSALTPDEVVVYLGKYNLSLNFERGSEIFYPTDIFVHPQWNIHSERYDADIAIVYSETKIRFSTQILPVCIWSGNKDDSDDFEGTVVGWGNSAVVEPKGYVEIPRQVRIQSIPSQKCYEDYHLFAAISSERTFCAGGVEINSGPCTGDSGGGFFVVQNNIWFIRGIVSASFLNSNRNCDVTKNAIFTKINEFNDWLNEKLGKVNSVLRCNFQPTFYLFKGQEGKLPSCVAEDLSVPASSIDFTLEGSRSRNEIIYFEVKKQNTTFFPNNVGYLFPNLKYVLNEASGLKFVERKNFANMGKVKELSLAHSLIESVPFDSFFDLVNIEKIYFHFNKLTSFHKNTFDKNINLLHVYAYANRIEFLPAGLFSTNNKLIGIHFDNNQIKKIDLVLNPQRQYERLNFRNNACIDKVYPDDLQQNALIEEIKSKC